MFNVRYISFFLVLGLFTLVSASASSTDAAVSGIVIYHQREYLGQVRIVTTPATGGATTELVDRPGEATSAPDLSPDGRRLAYDHWLTGSPGAESIYVLDLLTMQTSQVTNGAVDFAPKWSPDGSSIVFASMRDGDSEIYVMDADGQNITQLTHNTVTDDVPAWSPDGSKIVFASRRMNPRSLWVMDADGSDQTRLVTFESYDPSWSPDGSKIAFAGYIFPYSEIYMMNADGTGIIKVTTDQTLSYGPEWSPDGQTLVYDGFPEGNAGLYMIDIDGTDQAFFAAGGGADWVTSIASPLPTPVGGPVGGNSEIVVVSSGEHDEFFWVLVATGALVSAMAAATWLGRRRQTS